MTLYELLKGEVREEEIVDWLGVLPSGSRLIELRSILLGLKDYMEKYREKQICL